MSAKILLEKRVWTGGGYCIPMHVGWTKQTSTGIYTRYKNTKNPQNPVSANL